MFTIKYQMLNSRRGEFRQMSFDNIHQATMWFDNNREKCSFCAIYDGSDGQMVESYYWEE